MTDFSPEGAQERANLDSRTMSALRSAEAHGDRDRIAKEAMIEKLAIHKELFDESEHLRDLNSVFSPLQIIRMAFDHMPRQSEEHWRNIAARMAAVSNALVGYRVSLV